MECTPTVTDLIAAGLAHHAGGHLLHAVECYSGVLATQPEHGEAWRLLGVVAMQAGDLHSARRLLGRSLRIDPNNAAAHGALGSVAECASDVDGAQNAYEAAWMLDPTQPAAAVGLARFALLRGNARDAIAIVEAALALRNRDDALFRMLGAARLEVGDYAGAAQASLAALKLAPHADAYANLGAACLHLRRFDAAVAFCEAALDIDPTHPEASNNLGVAHKAKGAFPAAVAAFARSIGLGSEQAHVNLGTTRLLLGDYHAGWPEYGWVSPERRANPAFAALPMWDGTPGAIRRLVIWPEQGIGDTIQMVRFLAAARKRVENVTLSCPPGTLDLLRTVDGVDACIDTRVPVPFDAFDAWLPTIRLPVIFAVSPHAIPGRRYLQSDPQRRERFAPLIDSAKALRVGLVWSGSPAFRWNDLRSCGLAELEAVFAVAGVSWFALQQGVAQTELPITGTPLVPINAQVADFADTAAIIDQLDLVITVDTAVAHVAGALGRPAWVLLSSQPDWRWKLSGDVSPWYPSLRLFRQGGDGLWGPVVAAVGAALRELVISRKQSE